MWILANYSLCTGCRLCEIACSLRHEGVIWPSASRITVYEHYPGVPVPHYCVQCPDYPCVGACPTRALRVDQVTGAVLVDPSLCTLCLKCVEACPGRVPKIARGKLHVLICDLCSGDPACVRECSRAGYNALKLVKKPSSTNVKHYAKPPELLAEELGGRVFT
ncbi:MAG: 4Fe-4S dicluster domain-containing protein [Sulfolobales archaeon]|nr:4Fe-4S dicluster domain-containing protein [Sulfolobales archaeon]MCX8209201.1 4Fe-4S dicluster domain-containing protein [Sulfolobales archaeon]MDW8010182.1 4Fe-4S dicluster domain-containing protein [Sulfolobales archaeon]